MGNPTVVVALENQVTELISCGTGLEGFTDLTSYYAFHSRPLRDANFDKGLRVRVEWSCAATAAPKDRKAAPSLG